MQGRVARLETDITTCLLFVDVDASNTSKALKMPRGPPVVFAEGHALKPVLWFPGDSVAAMVDSDLEQVCDRKRGSAAPTQPSPEANPYQGTLSRRCTVHLSVTQHVNAPSCEAGCTPPARLLHS